MKTIEIQIYTFEELSKEAQERAVKKEQDYRYQDPDLLFMFNEDIKYQAEEKGFITPEFQYSLSYCPGDGLSFSFDGYKHLKDLFLKHLGKGKQKTASLLADNCTLIAKGNTGRYCFASSSDIDLYLENYTSAANTDCKNINNIVNKVLNDLENLYIDFCKELEKQGYSEIEYLTSEEACEENLIINEYDFTEDGEIY